MFNIFNAVHGVIDLIDFSPSLLWYVNERILVFGETGILFGLLDNGNRCIVGYCNKF